MNEASDVLADRVLVLTPTGRDADMLRGQIVADDALSRAGVNTAFISPTRRVSGSLSSSPHADPRSTSRATASDVPHRTTCVPGCAMNLRMDGSATFMPHAKILCPLERPRRDSSLSYFALRSAG